MVHNNADTPSLLAVDSCLFELGQRETAALTDFAVVTDGLATHSRAEQLKWTNTKLGCLGLASISSAEFTAGLVEPGTHPTLPVLVEVVGVKNYRS